MRTFLLASLACASTALAQCPVPALFGGQVQFSTVLASGTWDTDGPGPLGDDIVVAATDTTPGSPLTIRAYRNGQWRTLASNITIETNTTQRSVRVLTSFDPDGSGPQLPLLIAAGDFTHIDGLRCSRIAAFDGTTWRPLGAGMDASPYAVTTFDLDGDGPIPPKLVAGGAFQLADLEWFDHIAQWDGLQWTGVGWGFDQSVFALTTWDPDGDGPLRTQLIAGGFFQTTGDDEHGEIPARRLAAWDGQSWRQLGGGVSGDVSALSTFDPDGAGPLARRLVVAGYFAQAGDPSSPINVPGFALWDNASWSTLASVNALKYPTTIDPDGQGPLPETLYAIRDFYNTGPLLARWDGTQWLSGGPTLRTDGSPDFRRSLASFRPSQTSAPSLLMTGYLNTGLNRYEPIVIGNDQTWTGLDRSINGPVRALTQWDPDAAGPLPPRTVAGGEFLAQGTSGDFVSYWDGAAWRNFGWGADAPVNALTTWDPDNTGPLAPQLIMAGEFTNVGADSTGLVTANRIARWDGTAWRALASGLDGNARALTTFDPDASGPAAPLLIAAGDFTHASGINTGGIASWNGTTWRALGWGVDGPVYALLNWDPDGAGPLQPQLVAAGDFTHVGSDSTGQLGPCSIARWNGTAWTSMGGTPGIRSLVIHDFDGPGPQQPQLLAGGTWGIKQWNGSSWDTLGSGLTFRDYMSVEGSFMPISVEISVDATSLAMTSWDPDAAGPLPPELYIAAAYSFYQPPVQTYKGTSPGHTVSHGPLARFNGRGFQPIADLFPAALLATAAGTGNQLVIGGSNASYTTTLATSSALRVLSEPISALVPEGRTHTMSVGASGGAPTYQWQARRQDSSGAPVWENLAGSTSPSLTVTSTDPPMGQPYPSYRCIISDAACPVHTSSAATIYTIPNCGTADFNNDGDSGTDADIEAFFACLAGSCCPTCQTIDFNRDDDSGTDADIEAFFRVLAGGAC